VTNRAIIVAIQASIVACFFGLWEIGAHAGWINPAWFSPPFEVLVRLGREIQGGHFVVHFWATLVETLAGFVIGVIGGVALGLTLGVMPRLRQILMPYLLMLYGIPRPALAPVFVLWFGIGLLSKIVLIVSLVYFVLLMYVLVGIRAINPALIQFAFTTGAKSRQVVQKIMIPSVMPYVFAGMKLGIGLAIVGAVVGEIIASREGLGYYIFQAAQRGDIQAVYAGLAALGIMSLVLVLGMEWLDRRLFHWRQEVTL